MSDPGHVVGEHLALLRGEQSRPWGAGQDLPARAGSADWEALQKLPGAGGLQPAADGA